MESIEQDKNEGHIRISNGFIDSGTWAKLSLPAKAVLPVLMRFTNYKSKSCRPSHDTLAKLAGVTRRTIIKVMKELEALGIEAEPKNGKVNVYKVPVNNIHRCTSFTGEQDSHVNDIHTCTKFTGESNSHVNDIHTTCEGDSQVPVNEIHTNKKNITRLKNNTPLYPPAGGNNSSSQESPEVDFEGEPNNHGPNISLPDPTQNICGVENNSQSGHEEQETGFEVPEDLRGLELYEQDQHLCGNWEKFKGAWVKAYPHLDVMAEVTKAHAWYMVKRKRGDPSLLILRWLNRARGGTTGGSNGGSNGNRQRGGQGDYGREERKGFMPKSVLPPGM